MLRLTLNPTGDIEISSLQIVIYNYILSKQLNEELIIKIKDNYKKDDIKNEVKNVLELLSLFSLDISRVIYQSENIKYHTQIAMKLLLDKKAFNCFCSDEIIKVEKKKAKKENISYKYSGFCQKISDETKFHCNAPFVVRINEPKKDIKVVNKSFNLDSFIILNRDKIPTDNFACGVDDMLFDISTIITQEDQLPNIAKQIHIRKTLGYDKNITYIDLPLIDTQENSSSLKWLINEGYLPVAISNYLIILGYDTPVEIFTIEDCIKWFDITKISKTKLKFDIEKLNHINKEHIKLIDELRLSKILGYADTDIGALAKVYLQECNTIKEIKSKLTAIFSKKDSLKDFDDEFKLLKQTIQNAPYFNTFDDLKQYLTKQINLKDEKLLIPLRYLITKETNGIDLDQIYPSIKNYLGEIIQ